jgi:predicted component of type VI protein secretion system
MAAMRGRKLKDLVEERLRLVLEARRKSQRQRLQSNRMKRARGVVDSGLPDLASNPAHLTGFGRNSGHR